MIKKQLLLNNKIIEYYLRSSPRARRLSLSVRPQGLIVTAPQGWLKLSVIEKLIREKQSWINKQLKALTQQRPLIKNTRANYLKYRQQARSLVADRLKYYNQLYRFKIKKVCLRNQQTRWGSCSKQGNLNFNYRLIFLPTDLVDYIIVHELCHLAELNHSPKFWRLVEQTMPQHRRLRKELKKYSLR